jgi:hypothetical protein
MKRINVAAIAAMGLMFAWHGALHAAGQPQCDSAKNAGAAQGQKYGTSADVAAKKQIDTQKYETAGANSATEACEKQGAPAGSTSSKPKH